MFFKQCNKCLLYKSPNDFYKNRNDCKKCNNKTSKKYYNKNKERIKKLKSRKALSTCASCKREININVYELNKNLKINKDFICKSCKIHINRIDKSKYIIDFDFFKKIDSEESSYLLGIIAGDGGIRNNEITITAHKDDIETLHLFNKFVTKNKIQNHHTSKNCLKLNIYSKKIQQDVCNALKVKPGKKSDKIRLPQLPIDLQWHFIRGLMDSDGCISKNKGTSKKYKRCFYSSTSNLILKDISDFASEFDIKSHINGIKLTFNCNNAIMFLTHIYKNSNFKLSRKFNRFTSWVF